MRIAWGIFKHDVKAIMRNPFALIVALGILVLPALFAWYAIDATWSPYSRTDGLKVAIVNEDSGIPSDELQQRATAAGVDAAALAKLLNGNAGKAGVEAANQAAADAKASSSAHSEQGGEQASVSSESGSEQGANEKSESSGEEGSDERSESDGEENALESESSKARAEDDEAANAGADNEAADASTDDAANTSASASAEAGASASASAASASAAAADSAAKAANGPTSLNIGSLMTDAMKDGEGFDWQFVSAEEGRNGLESGEYYAEFVLPEGFTDEFLRVLSGELEHPTIEYWVNEKYNATAFGAVDEGAGVLDAVVKRAFSALAAEALESVLNDIGGNRLSKESVSSSLGTGIDGAQQDLKTVDTGLTRAKESIEQWRVSAKESKEALDSLKSTAPALRDSIADGKDLLADARTTAHKVSSTYGSAFAQGNQSLSDLLTDLKGRVEEATAPISDSQKELDAELSKAEKSLNECESLIASLIKVDPDSSTLKDLKEQNQQLKEEVANLKKASKAISDAAGNTLGVAGSLSKDAESAIESLRNRTDTFNGQTLPKLDTSLDSLALVMGSLDGALGSLDAEIAQVEAILASLDQSLLKIEEETDASFDLLKKTTSDLASAKSDVASLANAKAVQEATEAGGAAAQSYEQFMASPINAEIQQAYPLSSYGAGMAPFYMCLAIWVGCLMLIVIIKLEVDPMLFPRRRPWQGYVGRLLLIGIVAVLQGVVITAGAVVMGIQPVSIVALVIAGVVTASCFASIVFALAITFKHVGKVLAVVLLIVQIPGASGMYPVELMPKLLQVIYPWTPFTYGTGAMREAIGGFYGLAYAQDVLWLIACGLASLALALLVRPHVLNLNRLFDHKLEQADLFIAGGFGLGFKHDENSSFAHAVRKLLDDKDERALLLMRTRKFAQRYAIVKYAAPLAVIALTVALVIVSLVLPLSANEKILSLMVFILALLVVFAVCLGFEYAFDNMTAQLAQVGVGVGELRSTRNAAPIIAASPVEEGFIQPVQDVWDTDDSWANDSGFSWEEHEEEEGLESWGGKHAAYEDGESEDRGPGEDAPEDEAQEDEEPEKDEQLDEGSDKDRPRDEEFEEEALEEGESEDRGLEEDEPEDVEPEEGLAQEEPGESGKTPEPNDSTLDEESDERSDEQSAGEEEAGEDSNGFEDGGEEADAGPSNVDSATENLEEGLIETASDAEEEDAVSSKSDSNGEEAGDA